MIMKKNKTCQHCGKPNRTIFGQDEHSLFCCVECEVELSFAFLPFYEYWNNEELVLAKASMVRSKLTGMILGGC